MPQLWVQNSKNKSADSLALTRFNEPLPQRKKKKVRNKQKILADKRLNRLKRTSELARANRQADANARVLAFNSVADEISYNPHFSQQAIAAVLHEDRETDKTEVSIKPALAVVPTVDNKAIEKIEKNNDKEKTMNLDIGERLVAKVNQLFTMQSVQSDPHISLLDRLLLSAAFPEKGAQIVTQQRNLKTALFKESLNAGGKKVIGRSVDSTTITPFLSSSLVLSPIGFSSLFQMFFRQKFWIKSRQKNALSNTEYPLNTTG